MSFDIDGEIIDFDTSDIAILEQVLNYFNLQSIEEIFSKYNNKEIFKHLYQFEKTNGFQKLYRRIIESISVKINETEFYFQKIPSFRLHRTNQKSVNFHNDYMYGHGSDVINIWLPLVSTNKYNALYLSTADVSKKLSDCFNKDQLSIDEANKLFRKNCNPVIIDYGKILIFKTTTIHGTVENLSDKNRLSFDFRILPFTGDSGTKPLNEFYESFSHIANQKIIQTPCMYYLNKKNPLMKNCSHFVQREIMNMYSNDNNLNSNGAEESEIHGVSHYPVILNYIRDKRITNIVMASILCLPSEIRLRTEVLKMAKKNNVNLHFSIENTTSENISIDDANSYYQLILNANNIL